MQQTEYIDDLPEGPADPEKVLSDEELIDGGLVPVAAYVRTRASKNALRVQRAKARAEAGEDGPARKQLNISAPPDDPSREALKAAANALLHGSITAEALTEFVTGRAKTSDTVTSPMALRADAMIQQSGWRSALLKALLRD